MRGASVTTDLVSDTLSGFFGAALIVGLFVAYAMQRRARNRSPAALETVEPPPDTRSETEPATSSRSPNWGMPIVYCLLLVAADSHRGTFWGYLWQGTFLAILALAAYSTFSPKELASEQMRRPGTTRADHYLSLGVPYLLFPAIGWTLVVVVGWPVGILVPAIPWLLMLLAGAVVVLWQTVRPTKH